MTLGPEYLEFERIMARALRSPDPVRVLREERGRISLGAELDACLAAVDEEGLRLSALLVAKLRFERLLQGSAKLGEQFAEDAASFSAEFKRYHLEVQARARGPAEEAACFMTWRSL